MGTGFTIDTPLKVARYGISSVVSIGDDILMEQMRKFHCEKNNIDYKEIPAVEEDSRARRITSYLNLLDSLIREQIAKLRAESFEPGSDISRYFEMLPETDIKREYRRMLAIPEPAEKRQIQESLRHHVVPGSIDVNIMTKVDGDRYREGCKLPPLEAVALSAFRGFAKSRLRSSLVLSAGLNRRLFGYISEFDDFFPDKEGLIRKKLILKVSDYRSAIIQGKMLASLGLWVSEYRLESGVNCGGHAFTAQGHLMGPILHEFRKQREALRELLHNRYCKALKARGLDCGDPAGFRITVQGGIGTADENRFLRSYYEVDGTGWGTPFLLVPEATNVDDIHLEKLSQAMSNDVYLSDSSPLGIPFWNLRTSTSEETRKRRILTNRPGSPCPKGFLGSDTEFSTIPLCRASRRYQKSKLKLLSSEKPSKLLTAMQHQVVDKSCLCLDLAGGVLQKTGIDPQARTTVCCGPSIADFKEIVSLEKMVDHIYGRLSLINDSDRPHMFIREIGLYVDYLRQELEKTSTGLINRTTRYFSDFRKNLEDGIEYYRELAEQFGSNQKKRFLQDLDDLAREIERLLPDQSITIVTEGAV
jgi:hypothetical protein